MDGKHMQNKHVSQFGSSQRAYKSIICLPMDMGAPVETEHAYICAEKVAKTQLEASRDNKPQLQQA